MRVLSLWCIGLLILAFTRLSLADAAQPDVPSLQLSLAVAADYSPMYPTQTFPPTTKEVTAGFNLGKDESFTKLTATWIAVDVGAAAPPNYEIATAELALQGKRKGKFTYTQPNPLPIGKYRLDVAANGKPWQSLEFSVAGPTAVAMARPADLLPLAKGRLWTYAFVQEAGCGVQFLLEGQTARPPVLWCLCGRRPGPPGAAWSGTFWRVSA